MSTLPLSSRVGEKLKIDMLTLPLSEAFSCHIQPYTGTHTRHIKKKNGNHMMSNRVRHPKMWTKRMDIEKKKKKKKEGEKKNDC